MKNSTLAGALLSDEQVDSVAGAEPPPMCFITPTVCPASSGDGFIVDDDRPVGDCPSPPVSSIT